MRVHYLDMGPAAGVQKLLLFTPIFIQLDPTLRSIVHTWSTIKDIMILLQWTMMWCIFYIGFVRDPASILVGFVGDLPSVILCKHDCRIVKSTHQQHIEFSMR